VVCKARRDPPSLACLQEAINSEAPSCSDSRGWSCPCSSGRDGILTSRDESKKGGTTGDGTAPYGRATSPLLPGPLASLRSIGEELGIPGLGPRSTVHRGCLKASAATHHGQEQNAAALDQRSEPCRRETRLLPFLTRCENLSRHSFDRGRRNPLRGARVSDRSPLGRTLTYPFSEQPFSEQPSSERPCCSSSFRLS
jgi:hypothetical protein